MQPEDQRQLGTRQMIKVTKNVSCCLNTAHHNAATGIIPTLKKIPPLQVVLAGQSVNPACR